MELRDPVHGPIHILPEESSVINDPFFQRLRKIKQLGLSEYIFPGATHTRYLHSIGVMSMATLVFDKLFHHSPIGIPQTKDLQRIRESFRLAALLHDLGHAPLSHSTEVSMPLISSLKLPKRYFKTLTKGELKQDRQATHEDYTVKIILDSTFTSSLKKVKVKFGVEEERLADLIIGTCHDPDYFTIGKVNYFPLLHQLISSEIDCDRMDYLQRDSYYCGVTYGHFDQNWITDNLGIARIGNKAYLGISERAVYAFDHFLLARYHMFLTVYFHYRAVCLEQLLYKYFKAAPLEYQIPSKIDDYLKHDDSFLLETLKRSTNLYAKKVVLNSIPQKIFESFNKNELKIILELESYLKEKKIDYIRCSSKGRLSKYYHPSNRVSYPLKVIKSYPKGVFYINIDESTELFNKYSETHSIERIHLDLDKIPSNYKNTILNIVNKKKMLLLDVKSFPF